MQATLVRGQWDTYQALASKATRKLLEISASTTSLTLSPYINHIFHMLSTDTNNI